jgi:hypothetical protein
MASRVMGPFQSLWRWIRRRRRLDGVTFVPSMNDLPERLSGQIFVIGTPAAKWAVLECPCRCGERIDVNLMHSRRPFWGIGISSKGVTLAPSLWMPADKCGSHFFIRDNRILWVQ